MALIMTENVGTSPGGLDALVGAATAAARKAPARASVEAPFCCDLDMPIAATDPETIP